VPVSKKLPILAVPLRFVALSTENPGENSHKPYMLRNYSVLFFGHTFVADS